MNKNLFLTFCFSLIPGLGQMYQEYMKRGLSLLSIAFLSILLGMMFGGIVFLIPIPVIMAFSFFDSFRLRNMAIRGEELPEDKYIIGGLDKNFFSKKRPLLGIIFILLGAYFLADTVIISILYRLDLDEVASTIRLVIRYIPAISVSLIAMWVGTRMILGKGENHG